MSETCNHDCSSCSANCSSRNPGEMPKDKPHLRSRIKHVIGVVSGKGGVGKSFVTSLLAVEMTRRGYSCGILDADITGPSIPKMFGMHERATGDQDGIYPVKSQQGIQVMSLNLLLEKETDPVIWRGALITGTVRQFWTDVVWEDVDYLFIDMPPGTGDVTLTVFQSLPVDGIVIVSSPQELVQMIVGKAVKMAQMMKVPVLGLVENMSYLKCPDCGKEIEVFGKSRAEEMGKEFNISPVMRLPLNPAVAQAADEGRIEFVREDAVGPLLDKLAAL
ncbi:Mrp/NBP35 family ATP-binding protein [Candidatus Avelusimicrobium gallicola]|uniref:Iron-sulfur cluster carrier protein n=1 Tax=Candidatus Avelusimicrobium gallicola TaxID=2562704 RepID=A0A1Y4DPC6_9BACT|nr:Mrp/NBP35 family ATP-binding protein [Elusimicrobium sp. An273]OUO57241.1 ATP-binding protein [Elusimicrobium sp. An273]